MSETDNGLSPATEAPSNGDKRLFLLDAYALIYRAYFSFIKAPRINSRGFNTSAAFGFTLTLLDLIKREKPTHIAVVFDTDAPTDRHLEHTAYKADRQEMPDDLRSNVPYIRRIIEAFNIPLLESDGYEADDVIGTLAKKAEAEGYLTYMVTPDKDFGQLVTDRILMYKPGRAGSPPEVLGPKEICARWGLRHTDQVRDILGLMGDAVDNIPGIPGVGEKTAMKLVQEFGSLEAVIEHANEIKGKLGEKVKEHAEQGLFSKKLATILTDAPVEIDHTALNLDPPDKDKILDVFSELEFRTLVKSVLGDEAEVNATVAPVKKTKARNADQMDMFGSGDPGSAGDAPHSSTPLASIHSTEHDYRIAATAEEQEALVQELAGLERFCFDTETTSIDERHAELVGLAFSWKPHAGWYVPIPSERSEADEVVARFKAVLEDPGIEKVGQNIKYDLIVLEGYGIHLAGTMFDTMLAHYLLQPELRHGMDYLAETVLGYRPVSITELIGPKGKGQKNMREVPVEQVAEYAAEDADITWQLHEAFAPRLKEDGLEELFRDMEMPLVRVLADMEMAGIRLDVDALKDYGRELGEDILKLQAAIKEACGHIDFNIDSPRQLGDVLFGSLKIGGDKPKKTRTGQYQTSEDVLTELKDAHPVVPLILEYRMLRKLKSTYVDTLPTMVDPRTGRVHTSYKQAVAATGRLSSEDPNLQNIPIRTEKGRAIRKAFVPRDADHLLLSADYSQIELRVIAHMSGDHNLQEAFRHGLDIHAATAAKVFSVDINEVTREQRSKAKAVNFGIAYGQGAFGLGQNLGIPRAEARQIIDDYFMQFPGVRHYMDTQIELARKHGHVTTLAGRRRYLPDINSANQTVRAQAERIAINAPMQGTAADIIKLAMVRIHARMRQEELQSRLLLQVHDELVLDVQLDEVDRVKALVRELMESAMKLDVPLVVDMNVGKNWLEAH